MKIVFAKYPIDILLCILWSVLLLPIALLSMDSTIRTILGLPFLLFIPGYLLLYVLFPTKKGIDGTERIALSFGLSIAIVPMLGFILNYTPWGIRLEPVLISLFFFIIGVGIIALYRWKTTTPDKRLIVSINIFLPKSNNKLNRILTIILGISIILAMATLIYVIITPKIGETFTEFYLLGPTGKATGYPHNLTIGENATIFIGLVNHEYKTMNYTIEIWLINQTTVFNTSTQENQTIYQNMWFMGEKQVALKPILSNIEKTWKGQWENIYTFHVNRSGNFKLTFLLFTTPTENYSLQIDYKELAKQKISTAYESTFLTLNIFEKTV